MNEKIGESIPVYFLLSIIIIISVFLLRSLFQPVCPPLDAFETAVSSARKIVIDPGHGGKDGGAVSLTGTHEKHLNLCVAFDMTELLHALGYEVILTRDSDIELTHPDGGTRKMQDLKGRLEIAQSNPGAFFVSIHMNKFAEEKYSGLQVYYSPNDNKSRILADSVQETVRHRLQKDNDRAVKKATSDIFLLDKISSPAILIECGFISNQSESKLLDTPEYRRKLSYTIVTAVINAFER